MKKSYGVVIAAGGSGTRFGTDIPKQFVEISGIPVIAHTILPFQNCKEIKKIVIVAHKDYLVFCSDIQKRFGFSKVSSIIEGGATRQASVFKGIKALDTDYVLIHDAARPVISEEKISMCCEEVAKSGSCALGIPSVDTIKVSLDGEYISSTPDRSTLWQIQTPQCFERDFILKCHRRAAYDGFEGTDDCMLAEMAGAKVKLIQGDRTNIKITDYADLALAEVLLND